MSVKYSIFAIIDEGLKNKNRKKQNEDKSKAIYKMGWRKDTTS
jgi:hypothetical protein